LLSLPAAARGGPVTWEFVGEVTRVFDPDNLLDGEVVIGNPMEGTFTFESTTSDGNPSPTIGSYHNAVTGVDATVGVHSLEGPTVPNWNKINSIAVYDGTGPFPDAFDVFTAVDFLGQEFFIWRMLLSDANGNLFVTDALPMSPPDLELVQTHFSIIDPTETIDVELGIDGNLTLLRLVPEPSAITLLSLGALACTRRRG